MQHFYTFTTTNNKKLEARKTTERLGQHPDACRSGIWYASLHITGIWYTTIKGSEKWSQMIENVYEYTLNLFIELLWISKRLGMS